MSSRSRTIARDLLLGACFGGCCGLAYAASTALADPNVRAGGAIGTVDPAALERHVVFLAETSPPRTGSAPLRDAAAYIESEFERGSGRVSRQAFAVDGDPYFNVIAAFGPTTHEKVVVGAHYDTALGYPGADDDASGVAALIELSRLLDGASFHQRVELVAYPLEEPPYFRSSSMGSAAHATLGEPVSLMISLEMIGCFSEEPESQHYPAKWMRLFYPDRGDFIAVVGRLQDFFLVQRVRRLIASGSEVPVRSLSAPTWVPGIDFSDHLSYWNAGYDAVMITDTAFYRNERYHTADDRPATLDYDRMAEVVRGVLHAIESLAQ